MYRVGALLLAAVVLPATAAPVHSGMTFSAMQIAHYGFQGRTLNTNMANSMAMSGGMNSVGYNSSMYLTGELDNTPILNDVEYLSPVTIGKTVVYLDFDTGSSDLWVYGKGLPATTAGTHTLYDYTQSRGARLFGGEAWNISYADGTSASGFVVFDTVDIGGIQVASYPVEVANKVSSVLATRPNPGFVGLGWPLLNTVYPDQQLPFFFQIIDSLQEPLFCAALKQGQPGTWDFGFIDSSKFDGDIHYAPVDSSNGFWQFAISGVMIGNTPLEVSLSVIADSGTTLLLLRDSIVEAYYAEIEGASFDDDLAVWTYPCTSTLLPFGVTLADGYQATIPAEFMEFLENGDGTCTGALQLAGELEILGDIFYKSQYIVHNGGTSQLGMAPQKGI